MTPPSNEIFKSPSDSKIRKIESQSPSYTHNNFMDNKLNSIQKIGHHSNMNINQKSSCMMMRPDSHGEWLQVLYFVFYINSFITLFIEKKIIITHCLVDILYLFA